MNPRRSETAHYAYDVAVLIQKAISHACYVERYGGPGPTVREDLSYAHDTIAELVRVLAPPPPTPRRGKPKQE